MLGFLKRIFRRGDDLDLDLDLDKDTSQLSDTNFNANLNTPAGTSQSSFMQQQSLSHEEPSFLNPRAFIPYQPPTLQQEDNIRQQLEILQSKIDTINSKLDLLIQRLQMLEQYLYYRR